MRIDDAYGLEEGVDGGGTHETDTVTFAKSNQLHKQHKLEEYTGHESGETVIRDGCGEILGKMAFDVNEIVVLEIGERAEMIAYDDGHNFAL